MISGLGLENEFTKLRRVGIDSPGKETGGRKFKEGPGVWDATEHKKDQNIGEVKVDRERQR